MNGRSRDLRATVAAVLFLLTGLYLAARVWETAREVLRPATIAAAVPAEAASGAVEAARTRDARVAAVTPPSRDPFHAPPRRWRPPPRAKEKPKAEAPPRVRMILYDAVHPEVQIEVDGRISGRLAAGNSFAGWTVVSISENAVVVSKDGKTHTLRLRSKP